MLDETFIGILCFLWEYVTFQTFTNKSLLATTPLFQDTKNPLLEVNMILFFSSKKE